jgi:DNA-binding transcriptional LysR family regulator
MQWSDRIGRRIKLRDLHIFLAVARCGSMAKAAELLAVSQPVVSKTISELEHALGVRLLDRTFQGAEPTAYGRAIVNCGIAVFDDLRRGVQEIEYLSDPTTGELWVGATLPLVEDLVPRVLEELAARYPRITCHTADIAVAPKSSPAKLTVAGDAGPRHKVIAPALWQPRVPRLNAPRADRC